MVTILVLVLITRFARFSIAQCPTLQQDKTKKADNAAGEAWEDGDDDYDDDDEIGGGGGH